MKKVTHDGSVRKNIPQLLLLSAGAIAVLMVILDSHFSSIAYYLSETYLIVPCLLFFGYALRGDLTVFARRRMLLSVAAVCWFVFLQLIRKLSGIQPHPIATVFFVYLMAFPFASSTEDHSNTGIRLIGGLYVTASLVLVGYCACLLLDRVPHGMQESLWWDGARLHVLRHPNITACYLMIGIGFAGAFYATAKKRWVKLLLLAAMMAQFLTMALTNCRTVLLTTGALFGGIAFFRIFRGSKKQFLLGILVAVALLVGSFQFSGMIYQWNNERLVAALTASQEDAVGAKAAEMTQAWEKTTDPFSVDHMGVIVCSDDPVPLSNDVRTLAVRAVPVEHTDIIAGDNNQGSLADDMRTLNGRTVIWGSALRGIRANKAIALWGTAYPGALIAAYGPYQVDHAHNSWMETLLRLGLPGLVLSLVFTGISVWSAAKLVLRKETETWKKIIAMTTMCVLISGFLEPYLFINNVLFYPIDFVFFFCTGYLDYWSRPNPVVKN